MKVYYKYRGKRYLFVWFENEHKNKIILVSNPNTDQEQLHDIPCKVARGVSIKVNKKSVSSDTGACGVISFIQRAARQNFMTVYIDRIIDQFTGTTSDWNLPGIYYRQERGGQK